MGACASIEERREASILRQPKQGEASDLYWACRNGDLKAVKKIIASTPYVDINRLEPNGSTALHAASFFGHTDVVELLLHQYGVMRHRRNRHGVTAYEEASTDEIRELFHRSSMSGRFCSQNTNDADNLFTTNGDETTENDEAPNDWVQGTEKGFGVRPNIISCRIKKRIYKSSILQRSLKHVFPEENKPGYVYDKNTAVNALQLILNEDVSSSHSEYRKACELLSKYQQTENVEHLLHLYSLETPLYNVLSCGTKANSLLVPLLTKLDSLQQRAFQGRTFRGLKMTQNSLKAYYWGLKHEGSILKTQSFSSTSVDINVAREFTNRSSVEEIPVLMVFDFPQKCDTAIQLFGIPNKLPCISEFEDEKEVLVLPMTFFRVTDIKTDKGTGEHIIYLLNVPTKGGLSSLINSVWKHSSEFLHN